MKREKRSMKILACGLSLLLAAGSGVPAWAAEEDDDAAVSKEETVYVMARENGSADKIIVSEWLKNIGQRSLLKDYTELKEIENVKGDETFDVDEEGEGTWKAEGSDIYYQGEIQKDLPVDMRIQYTLDGKKVSAKELAGESGQVEIRFDYTNNQKKGKVYVPFVVMTSLALDNEIFTDVEVTNGKVINDGQTSLVVGYALPGLEESLDLDESDVDIPDHVVVKCKATDFALSGTMTVATSNLLDDLDVGGIDSLDDLDHALDELESAASELQDGSATLEDGALKLQDGSSALKDGTGQLEKGSSKLKSGSKQLSKGTGSLYSGTKTLKEKIAQLGSGLKAAKDGTAQLKSGAGQLKTGAGDLESGAKQLQSGIKQASSSLDEAVAGLDQTVAGDKQVLAGLEQLQNTVTALANAKQMDAAQAKQINAVLTQAIGGLNQTIAGQEQVSQGLKNGKSGLGELQTGAGSLASGSSKLKTNLASLSGGADDLYAGIAAACEGAGLLEDGAGDLKDGAKATDKGAKSLSSGAAELNSGVKSANSGARQLDDGIGTLAEGTRDLSSGIAQFKSDGIDELVDAFEGNISKLADRLEALQDAAADYQSFAGKKADTKGTVKFIYKTDGI